MCRHPAAPVLLPLLLLLLVYLSRLHCWLLLLLLPPCQRTQVLPQMLAALPQRHPHVLRPALSVCVVWPQLQPLLLAAGRLLLLLPPPADRHDQRLAVGMPRCHYPGVQQLQGCCLQQDPLTPALVWSEWTPQPGVLQHVLLWRQKMVRWRQPLQRQQVALGCD